jgi:glycosyltransferase involved in cell wall biosynthesis
VNQPRLDTPDLSVVIACYMEQGHLADSIAQLCETLAGIGRSHELIFIDDKSTDGTAAVIAQLVDGHDDTLGHRRRVVYHERNVGRGGTVTEGFLLAEGDIVGLLDIDLEVHCRYLPALLAAIDQGADGATALRHYTVGRRPQCVIRHLLSAGYRRLFQVAFDVPFRDPETGFKFFRRDRILDVVRATRDVGWFWDSGILILAHQAGLRIEEVPCRFERRADKQSTVRIVRDVWAHLKAIYAFRKRQRIARPAGGVGAPVGPAADRRGRA